MLMVISLGFIGDSLPNMAMLIGHGYVSTSIHLNVSQLVNPVHI